MISSLLSDIVFVDGPPAVGGGAFNIITLLISTPLRTVKLWPQLGH
jgi:hypothetical protein